jgi:hypothetical protein
MLPLAASAANLQQKLSLRLKPSAAPALFSNAVSGGNLPYEFGNFEIMIIASKGL